MRRGRRPGGELMKENNRMPTTANPDQEGQDRPTLVDSQCQQTEETLIFLGFLKFSRQSTPPGYSPGT
jgi:hypothetical protein